MCFTNDTFLLQTELMTGSYSEILSPRFQSDLVAAEEVPPVEMLSAEGTVLQEGDMIHFVAKNLETKIRLSSPEVPGQYRMITFSYQIFFLLMIFS